MSIRDIGPKENYYIHDGYTARMANNYFDDTPFRDEYQDEVYTFARKIADREGLNTIVDSGCGSGYKLLKHFSDKQTVGVDLAPTVLWLRKTYPERQWCEPHELFAYSPDLVISADVIEHIPEPTAYLEYLCRMHPRYVVFSTPELGCLRMATEYGPPHNVHHVREWHYAQFGRYLSDFFDVHEHFIEAQRGGPQIALCTPREQQ